MTISRADENLAQCWVDVDGCVNPPKFGDMGSAGATGSD
jgi:hypothetical protein